jgi:transketolase
MPNLQELQDFTTQVRRDILRMVHAVQSGHPGGSLGCAEFLTVLYQDVMDYSTEFKMDGIGEDLFFLSNGHISPAYYSVLAHSGFFPVKELATFRKINTRLQGHPTTHEGLPGVRMSAGSLGQGLSVGIGAALAKKLNGDDKIVYTLHGDGELQEGQNWEAIMYASGYKVDNLIATVDLNGKQIDGATDDVLPMGDLKAKFEAFDWKVLEVKNGNDIKSIQEGLIKAKEAIGKGQPICILLHTEMGNGVDYMMHTHAWHGKAPNDDLLEKGLDQNRQTLGDY